MRTVLSFRQLAQALEPGIEKLTFIVARSIPNGVEGQLEPGQDVTQMVRSGKMPDDSMRSHVKRGLIIAVPPGARKPLRKVRGESRDVLRSALRENGIEVANSATHDQLITIHDLATRETKKEAASAAA